MSAKHTPGPDWYERRHDLDPGMVFLCHGTRWTVADWHDGWTHWGSEIEPGDLQGEPIENTPAAIAKATGATP